MADFCQQCSIATFGEDLRNFGNISSPQETAGRRYPVVLCEGCGPTQVDHEGRCVAIDCDERHGDNEYQTAVVYQALLRKLRDAFQERYPHYTPPAWAGVKEWNAWREANGRLHGEEGFKERFPGGMKVELRKWDLAHRDRGYRGERFR